MWFQNLIYQLLRAGIDPVPNTMLCYRLHQIIMVCSLLCHMHNELKYTVHYFSLCTVKRFSCLKPCAVNVKSVRSLQLTTACTSAHPPLLFRRFVRVLPYQRGGSGGTMPMPMAGTGSFLSDTKNTPLAAGEARKGRSRVQQAQIGMIGRLWPLGLKNMA